jgi:hypothetical protein
MLAGRDKKVPAFLSTHSNGVILTSFAATNSPQRLAPDSAIAPMGGSVDVLTDYFVSVRSLIGFEETNPLDNLVAVGVVQCGSGALNEHKLGCVVIVEKHMGVVKDLRVAARAPEY